MKVAYASRTGNVESIVDRLGLDALRIDDGSETIDEDFVVMTYTDGFGEVPAEVESFLAVNSANLKGVIVSGDTSYGEAFCGAGDVIADTYGVPCLLKVENDGTEEDLAQITTILEGM